MCKCASLLSIIHIEQRRAAGTGQNMPSILTHTALRHKKSPSAASDGLLGSVFSSKSGIIFLLIKVCLGDMARLIGVGP